MDMMRSFTLARTRMTSSTGEEFWVRWYPAAPGAKHYPDWHAFGSSLWEDDLTDEFVGPGTFHEPLLWRGSTFPAPPGQEAHGLPEWFEFGLPSSLLNLDVIEDLCGRSAVDPRGGIGLSGDAVMMGVQVPTDFQLDKIDTPLSSGMVNNLDLGSGGAFRLNPNGPLIITGFVAAANGRMVILENVGNDPIFIPHLSPGSDDPNRVICIDGFSLRLTPSYATWLQYDLTSEKWREMASVPIIREKGDLLTHTLTSATRLPVTTDPTHVLRANPATPTGLMWGPVTGIAGQGRDYWAMRHNGGSGVTSWHTSNLSSALNPFSTNQYADRLNAVPFLTPRNCTLTEIGIWCGPTGTAVRLGIYESVSDEDLYPDTLILDAGTVTTGTNLMASAIIDQDLEAGKLYWLALIHESDDFSMLGLSFPFGCLGYGDVPGDYTQGGLQIAQAFGPLPDPFPSAAVAIGQYPPAVAVKLTYG